MDQVFAHQRVKKLTATGEQEISARRLLQLRTSSGTLPWISLEPDESRFLQRRRDNVLRHVIHLSPNSPVISRIPGHAAAKPS
jgi:hypothetical protein